MLKRCEKCGLNSPSAASVCVRCRSEFPLTAKPERPLRRVVIRSAICAVVCVAAVLSFYVSLLASSNSLSIEEKHIVRRAINVLREKGFTREVSMLERFTSFRSDDHWLNASVPKENAFAATNFPFQIMTLYPDFFAYPKDDIERAAILLHEARHLLGMNEAEAYEYVWLNREQLGWTRRDYFASPVWMNVRSQTREYAPHLFNCHGKEYYDCTE